MKHDAKLGRVWGVNFKNRKVDRSKLQAEQN